MSETTYKVLILEPSEIVSTGLRKIIGQGFRTPDTGIVCDLQSAAERIRCNAPDIVVVNPSLLSDSSQLSQLRSVAPQGAVFAAVTYALFDEKTLRQFDAVISVFDSSRQTLHKLQQIAGSTSASSHGENYELSEREREILVSVARGKTNKEIADLHHISIHTVISHRKNIQRKTGIKTIAGLALYALLNNMISESDME